MAVAAAWGTKTRLGTHSPQRHIKGDLLCAFAATAALSTQALAPMEGGILYET